MVLPLSKNAVTVIDDSDRWVAQWKWTLSGRGYAYRMTWPERKAILLHRLLTDAPKGMLVDHINDDKLDNRRSNLRLCTASQNIANQLPSKRNTSGFKGVSWDRDRKKWAANIKVRGRQKHLGRYDDIGAAARSYEDAAKLYFGEFARNTGDFS